MSDILGEAAIETLLSDLCDVDGLRKATKAKGIADSHAALHSRLSALEEENARLVSVLGDEVVWLQASGDFGPLERLNRIFAIRRALAADATAGEEVPGE